MSAPQQRGLTVLAAVVMIGILSIIAFGLQHFQQTSPMALTAAVEAGTANSEVADAKCQPVIMACGCGEILQDGACVDVTDKSQNMHDCTCQGPTGVPSHPLVTGTCVAQNKCQDTADISGKPAGQSTINIGDYNPNNVTSSPPPDQAIDLNPDQTSQNLTNTQISQPNFDNSFPSTQVPQLPDASTNADLQYLESLSGGQAPTFPSDYNPDNIVSGAPPGATFAPENPEIGSVAPVLPDGSGVTSVGPNANDINGNTTFSNPGTPPTQADTDTYGKLNDRITVGMASLQTQLQANGNTVDPTNMTGDQIRALAATGVADPTQVNNLASLVDQRNAMLATSPGLANGPQSYVAANPPAGSGFVSSAWNSIGSALSNGFGGLGAAESGMTPDFSGTSANPVTNPYAWAGEYSSGYGGGGGGMFPNGVPGSVPDMSFSSDIATQGNVPPSALPGSTFAAATYQPGATFPSAGTSFETGSSPVANLQGTEIANGTLSENPFNADGSFNQNYVATAGNQSGNQSAMPFTQANGSPDSLPFQNYYGSSPLNSSGPISFTTGPTASENYFGASGSLPNTPSYSADPFGLTPGQSYFGNPAPTGQFSNGFNPTVPLQYLGPSLAFNPSDGPSQLLPGSALPFEGPPGSNVPNPNYFSNIVPTTQTPPGTAPPTTATPPGQTPPAGPGTGADQSQQKNDQQGQQGGGGGGSPPQLPKPPSPSPSQPSQPSSQQSCSTLQSIIGACPQPTCTLTASPATVTLSSSGVPQPVVLTWQTTNSVSATLSAVGTVPFSGTYTVYPQVTTPYSMQLTGQSGQGSCNATVTVTGSTQCAPAPAQPDPSTCTVGSWQPQTATSTSGVACTTGWKCTSSGSGTQPTATLSCSPSVADAGDSLAISYSCANATGSSGSGFGTANQTSGSTSTIIAAPPAGTNTATYGLTCTNGAQTATQQCSIQVGAASIVLVANPKDVPSGQTSSVGWITAGMQSCAVSSPTDAAFTAANANNLNANGVAQTSVITAPTEYDLTCTTVGGGTRKTSTIVSPQ